MYLKYEKPLTIVEDKKEATETSEKYSNKKGRGIEFPSIFGHKI
jgi:hypothetical protein